MFRGLKPIENRLMMLETEKEMVNEKLEKLEQNCKLDSKTEMLSNNQMISATKILDSKQNSKIIGVFDKSLIWQNGEDECQQITTVKLSKAPYTLTFKIKYEDIINSQHTKVELKSINRDYTILIERTSLDETIYQVSLLNPQKNEESQSMLNEPKTMKLLEVGHIPRIGLTPYR